MIGHRGQQEPRPPSKPRHRPRDGAHALGSSQWASQRAAAHWLLHIKSLHWPEPRSWAPLLGFNEGGLIPRPGDPPLGQNEPGPYISRLGPKAQAHLGVEMEPKPWARASGRSWCVATSALLHAKCLPVGQLRPQPFLATKKSSLTAQTRVRLLCLASGG